MRKVSFWLPVSGVSAHGWCAYHFGAHSLAVCLGWDHTVNQDIHFLTPKWEEAKNTAQGPVLIYIAKDASNDFSSFHYNPSHDTSTAS